ncbi:transcriptional regulator [Thauera sinica]|uniref:HTH cro/C1-type domain-containing protein n=1 Tax=Thauera sinica TaxID=2665146 RepID=A0ABW1ARX5_9RHOO|nr:transcriptional regulator [Thauera sp. K11]ATE58988.1 transcriptional regulator [Thauera sp. K11]
MDEKMAFSQRLADALRASGYEPRPSVLEKEFNTRYWGRPVTYQAVTRWLKGEAVPGQDKLQVLAEWLGVEPQYLRFGEAVVGRIRERKTRWEEGFSAEERQLLDAYLRLPMDKRKLLCELMRTFVAAYGEKDRT